MARIAAPATIETAPAAAVPLLRAVLQQRGNVPNLLLVMANSPAALQGYLDLNGALAGGSIGACTSERIALAIAEFNSCDYCLSAHTHRAKHEAKLDDIEITANRSGASNDLMADAAVHFATRIVRCRGHVSAEEITAFKAASYSDAEVVEVVALVADSIFANYLCAVTRPAIDFPVITSRRAA